MDIPRTRPARKLPPAVIAGGVVAGLLLTTLGLSRLRPAAPEVEGSTLLIDTVKRGPLVRQVHGAGTLVPENQRYVSAVTAGRVEQVLLRAGAKADSNTVLVVLSNPDVQLESLDAERQLKLAEADLASIRSTLESAKLSQEAATASSRTALREAERAVSVAERLSKDGLNSQMDVERARDQLTEAQLRYDAEKKRMEVATEALRAQIDLRKADVERLKAIARFQRERVASMHVRAGASGVVQELSLEPGQWVQSGQQLARVASPGRLKAVLEIPETQARDVGIGLPAIIDTRDGTVKGRVSRVDPGAVNGTVTVDITMEGALPRGARPDLSIDGTIEIERLKDVVFVGRPATGASETDAHLFKVSPDGRSATRVTVRLGRASFNAVEIVSGLQPDDRVILSDMDRFDEKDRVRIR